MHHRYSTNLCRKNAGSKHGNFVFKYVKSTKSMFAPWQLYTLPAAGSRNMRFVSTVCLCFVSSLTRTAIILYTALGCCVIITEMECVYCAVWSEFLLVIQTQANPQRDYTGHNRPCTYNVTLWRVRVTIIAMQTQQCVFPPVNYNYRGSGK